MAALRTDCFSVGHQFFGNNLLFIFLLEFYYPIFSLRSCRECTSAPPAVGHDAHRVLPKKNITARDLTGKLSPPAQKKEARKGPGNRLNIRCAPKTRFLLPTEIYRKRDDNYDTVGIPSSLLIGLVASISPLRPPPFYLSFCGNHLLDFLMAARGKLGERYNRGMTAI